MTNQSGGRPTIEREARSEMFSFRTTPTLAKPLRFLAERGELTNWLNDVIRKELHQEAGGRENVVLYERIQEYEEKLEKLRQQAVMADTLSREEDLVEAEKEVIRKHVRGALANQPHRPPSAWRALVNGPAFERFDDELVLDVLEELGVEV